MQFVKNGPDVPERLLQAHEDGKVVFFCGAGVSYPAGRPRFRSIAFHDPSFPLGLLRLRRATRQK